MFKFSLIDEKLVLKMFSSLDERKATGPDVISAKLLRMVAQAISLSITYLFNASMQSGQIPTEWKEANIIPVPKSGDKDDVSSYRPVSVIPVLAKIFKSLVHRQLYDYLETNSLLNDAQFGFRPNRSIQYVLLRTVDDWKIALDQGEIVGTVMIDLSKSFDMIDHPLLLNKLDASLIT